MRAGWLGTLLVAFQAAVLRIRATGAVPEDEFAPAVAVYKSLPFLLAAGLALLAWAAWKRRRPVTRIGFGLVAAGALWAPLLLIGAIVVTAGRRRGLPRDHELERMSAGEAAAGAGRLCALATVATLLLCLAESFLYVPRFVPRLVSPEQLAAYRIALPGPSALFGMQVGLMVGAVLVLAGRRPARMAQFLGLACGLALVGMLSMTMGDEILETAIAAHVLALGIAAGGLAFEVIWPRIEGRGQKTTAALKQDFFRFGLVPPMRHHHALTLAAGLAIFLVLYLALYPNLEDFRAGIFKSYATLATLLMMLELFLIVPRRYATRASAVLLAGCLVVAFTASTNSRVRVVAHEYSRFGSMAANSFVERLVDPFPHIGDEPVDGVTFPFHGPGEDRLSDGVTVNGKPLIVVLIWDAARADHCSAYGYERKTTPNLEKLAKKSLRFTRAYANATATTTSIRKLMSGRYNTRFMLATNHAPFFVKELADAGYERFVINVTGTDYNGVSLEGFQRGWDSDKVEFIPLTPGGGDAGRTRAVLDALKKLDRTGNTFAYLHLTGTHYPWADQRYGTSANDLYDGEMARADELLAELMGFLDTRDHVLVMTADHGTGLGEHGKIAGFYPYEEQVHVPLLISIPGVEPRVIDDTVALIDIAPTLLSLLTPGKPHRFHGRSLLPLLLGKTLSPRPIVSLNAFRDCYAIFDGQTRFKLHHDRNRRYELLFDLEKDPAELDNLIGKDEKTRLRLRKLLAAFLYEGRDSWANAYHYRDEKNSLTLFRFLDVLGR